MLGRLVAPPAGQRRRVDMDVDALLPWRRFAYLPHHRAGPLAAGT
jgi:hypothetical protein